MANLIKAAQTRTTQPAGLKKAGDAHHDPADLGPDIGARLIRVPLDQLTCNPENPRDEDLEADPATVELASSMTLIGQQQPAVIVPREVYLERWPHHANTITTPWVLMIGNRRDAAARINGWPDLECIVRDKITKDLETLADLPIHENLHRKGINPLRMAYYLADQKKLLGNEREVAKKVAKTQPWVNQLLRLLKLIPELQALVKSEEITATTGRALAKLDAAEQRRVWDTVAELDADTRAEFWSTTGWLDKPFITADAEPQVDQAQANKPVEAPERATRPVTIIIRITDPSPIKLAAALRERLSPDQVTELVEALRQPE